MHVHIRLRALRLPADPLKLLRNFDVVEALAGVRVKLLQLGAHDRAAEVVRHQSPDDAGLDDVLANPREAGLVGLEVHRQHVAGRDAVLHHLDEAHVRGEDGEHLGAVHSGQEEGRVGHLPQHREELGSEHVAVARHHRDDHAVRAPELLAILEKGLHVLVLERHELGEAGVDAQPGGEPTHRESDDREHRDHETAPGE